MGQGARAEELAIEQGWIVSRTDTSRREPAASVLARHGGQPLEADGESKQGSEKNQDSMQAFGAVFVEARVDRDLGIVRIPRIVAAYGVGKLLNEKTAHSQLMGGLVWGVSMA